MVVIAFLIPLALLVRNQASSRALDDGQHDRPFGRLGPRRRILAVGRPRSRGRRTGDRHLRRCHHLGVPPRRLGRRQSGTTIVRRRPRRTGGRALTADAEGGVEVLVPVTGAGATVVVRTFVTDHELTEGVLPATLALAGLGLVLIAAGVVLADRLGRNLVRPVAELASTARAMAGGRSGSPGRRRRPRRDRRRRHRLQPVGRAGRRPDRRGTRIAGRPLPRAPDAVDLPPTPGRDAARTRRRRSR